MWDKAHMNEKYTRPKEMRECVMKAVGDFYVSANSDPAVGAQPYIFYLDSRFSSINVLKRLSMMGYYGVMSCGSTMAPKFLGQFVSGQMKKRGKDGYPVDGKHYPYPDELPKELEKREWRAVFNDKLKAYFIAVRPKTKTYLYLMSNYVGPKTISTIHDRRKAPKVKYAVKVPHAQKEYNLHKNLVDNFNRSILTYMPPQRTETAKKKYVHYPDRMARELTFCWWARYLRFFIQILFHSSFIYFKYSVKESADPYSFRLDLLMQLRDKYYPQIAKQITLKDGGHDIRKLKGGSGRCQHPSHTSGNTKAYRECKTCIMKYCVAHCKSVHK